jgi:hypothetical protein
MIYSMTGYAAASRDLGSAVMNFEIKSVNSRYLDISFRLSEDLRFLEMPLREKLTERIGRGKIEFRGYLQAQPAQAGAGARTDAGPGAAGGTRQAGCRGTQHPAAGRPPLRGRSTALARRTGR